jgi:crotonobetainyl-CoA:carnitine CoA-transferase CaiB-like acyl-CoA transferase
MEHILKNIKVLDLSRYISGPFAGMILGDLGADVVKIEKAGKGDDTRSFEPKVNGESIYTFSVNRNKRSLEINFRSEEGKKLLKELIKKADILIENFRPGVMDKMGCGWKTLKEINPRLIMISISGFGASGPYKDKPGFDAAVQAMSGLMSTTGEPDGYPMAHGVYTVDHVAALYTAVSILGALISRNTTGKGQHIELSLLECASTLHLSGIGMQYKLGVTARRVGNQDRYISPGNCYKTADGQYIEIIAGSELHFPKLCAAMDMPKLLSDPKFCTQKKRFENREEMDRIVGRWFSEHTEEEAAGKLRAQGLVFARVEDLKDLINNPQLIYKKKLIEIEHPVMGKMLMMGQPYVEVYSSPEVLALYAKPLYYMLLKSETFVDRILKRYEELREGVLSEEYLLNYIDETLEYLGPAIERNNERWSEAMEEWEPLIPASRNLHSHEEAVEQLKDWLVDRGNWLDENIHTLQQYCHYSKNKAYNH